MSIPRSRYLSDSLGGALQASTSWCAYSIARRVSIVASLHYNANLCRGGIRGIVILEVLHSIEKEFGHRIPIQDFFDLIVGTRLVRPFNQTVFEQLQDSCSCCTHFTRLTSGISTGGILGLALGVKNMPVKNCIALFRKLIDRAFTPKLYGGLKIGKRKYRTRPLEEVLIENFKDELIFGGEHESSASYARKVAVTASCETGEQAVIFTNYNRADDDQGGSSKSGLNVH